jgi:hypothetical protein
LEAALKTPKAPDPVATANAQAGLNENTALTQQLINQTDQVNPWGSVSYTQNGTNSFTDSSGKTVTVPRFTQTTSYTPEQQAIFDKSTAAQTNMADIANQQSASLKDYLTTKFTPTGLPDVSAAAANTVQPGNAATDRANAMASEPFSFNNQDAANWSYDLASQRILPQQQQAQKALETNLVNRGLRPGTAAWNSEMSRMGQQNNDQLNQLALNGRQQAYNEALGTRQQAFNENSSVGAMDFQQQLAAQQNTYNQALGANQNAFQQQAYERSAPINEITALLSGSQIANPGAQSSATPQAQVAGVDMMGMVNQQYQAKLAASQSAMGGLFGLAGSLGSAAMMSDARLKTDIACIGALPNGLLWYEFRYVWDRPDEPLRFGLMAQDVVQTRPDAIVLVGDYMAVDYSKAMH